MTDNDAERRLIAALNDVLLYYILVKWRGHIVKMLEIERIKEQK